MFFTAAYPPLPAPLTLVQHVASSSTRTSPTGQITGSPFTFVMQFPATTTSGNAIVANFTCVNNVTCTVTDDIGNTYTTQQAHDATAGRTIGVAVATATTAGARVLTFTFSASPGNWCQFEASEFANCTGLGTAVTAHGTSTAPSVSPTVSGTDVAYMMTVSTGGVQSSWSTTGTFLSADRMDGRASQTGSTAMTMGTSDTWLAIGVALHVGAAGSVPSGFRCLRLLHNNIPVSTDAGGPNANFTSPLTLQLPTSGGTALAFTQVGGIGSITAVTGNHGNTWTVQNQFDDSTNQMGVSCATCFAPTNASDLTITTTWSQTNNDQTLMFYEWVGPTQFDQAGHARAANSDGAGVLTYTPTITPGASVCAIMNAISVGSSTVSEQTPGANVTNIATGENLSGPVPVDENNGWGQVVTSSASSFQFVHHLLTFPSGTTGPWTGVHLSLK